MNVIERGSTRPVNAKPFRKLALAYLVWHDKPFVIITKEGPYTIDETHPDWDGGYWVCYPDDGDPYAIAPKFVRESYEPETHDIGVRKLRPKTLYNADTSSTEQNVPDVVKFGNPDDWKLLCKASSESEGWMKSTKWMELGNAVLVQVSTQQRNPDGSYAVAEALAVVPTPTPASTLSLDSEMRLGSVNTWR